MLEYSTNLNESKQRRVDEIPLFFLIFLLSQQIQIYKFMFLKELFLCDFLISKEINWIKMFIIDFGGIK